MNYENINQIKKRLVHGDIKEIADRIGTTKQSVSNFLNGRHKTPNLLIIETALILIAERREYEKKVSKRMKALTEN